MKTNEQILNEITALMADAWLAACERRVIAQAMDTKASCMVIETQGAARLFGPSSADECSLFVHRAAALDVLRKIGTSAVSDAALMVADSNSNGKMPALNS